MNESLNGTIETYKKILTISKSNFEVDDCLNIPLEIINYTSIFYDIKT